METTVQISRGTMGPPVPGMGADAGTGKRQAGFAVEEHLRSFGIVRIDEEESYFRWLYSELGERLWAALDRVWSPMRRGASVSERDSLAFYDFIARPEVAPLVCSYKADAMRVSGEVVEKGLPAVGRILDVGCQIGQLTTFFALGGDERRVVGIDISPNAVASARSIARERGIGNVEYRCMDVTRRIPEGPFDAVVSTQVIGVLRRRKKALRRIAQNLAPGGVFLSVEALGSGELIRSYLEDARDVGLALERFECSFFSDMGWPCLYPTFTFSTGGSSSVPLDWKAEWDRCSETLAVLREGGQYWSAFVPEDGAAVLE